MHDSVRYSFAYVVVRDHRSRTNITFFSLTERNLFEIPR